MNIFEGDIPTFDLSEEKHCQVIVDREEGRYLGHVTTVLLSDNKTIIAVYVMGHGRGQIVMKRSPDGGMTWSDRLSVPESWSTALQIPTIYQLVDDKGKERLFLFAGHYPIRMSISEDRGLNWSELKPVGSFGGNVSMSDIIRLNDGRYMALFHDDGRYINIKSKDIRFQLYKSVSGNDRKVELFKSYSDDGGKTWSEPKLEESTAVKKDLLWNEPSLIYESYSGKKEKDSVARVYKVISLDGGLTWSSPKPITFHKEAYLSEPAAIYSPDKKQIAILLRDNSRKHNSFVVYSDDEGESWSKPKEVSKELTGDRHRIRYGHDGRIVVTFRDMGKDSPTRGDWVAWVGRYSDLLNEGKGDYKIRLLKNHKGNDCGYSGLELLPDDTFVTTSYGHWEKDKEPYIVSIRFKLKEIEAKYLNCKGF